ncbi:MAG: hypothetical protein ACXAC7_06690 [Candidatus Hodarchaeales archaeon]
MGTTVREKKRESFSAHLLTQEENLVVWKQLQSQFGIPIEHWQDRWGFVENRRGRLWLASHTALRFVDKEVLDPAKSLTTAIGNRVFSKKENGEFQGIRLTLDGVLVFGKKNLQKNLLEVSTKEETQWLAGERIERPDVENGIYILISSESNDLLGCSIATNGRLLNFLPKWRRLEYRL